MIDIQYNFNMRMWEIVSRVPGLKDQVMTYAKSRNEADAKKKDFIMKELRQSRRVVELG